MASKPDASRIRSALLAILTMPILAGVVHAGTFWFWHLPSLYAAVKRERIHAVEHATFALSAFRY